MCRFWSAVLMATVIFFNTNLFARDYPIKDIKVVVPFSQGGGVDSTIRMLAKIAPSHFDGQKFIVENMYEGGSHVAQAHAAKAEPDGYTLLAYTSSVVSNPIFKSTTFDHMDFKPLIMYCFDPDVLVVATSSPFKSVKDFLAASKKKPISMATSGSSTAHHIAAIMIEKNFDTKFDYIHLTSSSQQVKQLLAGEVQSAMMAYGEVMSYLKDGSLRVLGMMSDEEYAGAEKIKRFSKMGFNTEWGAFRGLAVPVKTPDFIVKNLSSTLMRMTKDPQFVESMKDAGFPLVVLGAEEFSDYVNENVRILLDMKNILQEN